MHAGQLVNVLTVGVDGGQETGVAGVGHTPGRDLVIVAGAVDGTVAGLIIARWADVLAALGVLRLRHERQVRGTESQKKKGNLDFGFSF